ncbi:MAG TPA: aspartate dehydrogenase [Beijerinckiaceae bacterium]|nr:aspartate dehydrogenase [Beijerinckiaceae bacterium]
MTRILVVGFGAIGEAVLAGLAEFETPVERAVLLRPGSPRAAHLPAGLARVSDLHEAQEFDPALVVEAAGAGAVRAVAPTFLSRGVPVVVTSAGALADDGLLADLLAARRGGARILVPSGAVGGLDYVAAAARLPGTQVRYESRKPPAAWADVLAARGVDPASLREPLVLFSGAAREAARLFPQNLNVAATLALAGIGMDRTRVEVVVDPAATGNLHAIRVEGPAGTFEARLANRPSPQNPKTSAVVASSILALIARELSGIRVG